MKKFKEKRMASYVLRSNELIQEGKEVELNCHFCNQNYVFSVEELKEILRKCK